MFEVKPYPEFSWSMSRHKTFFECKRKYAYQYYVSHNGWLYDSPISSQEAYFLKKLSNLPMYLGDLLHKAINILILQYRFKELPSLKNIEHYIRHNLNQAYKYSSNKQLWHQKPKDIPLLRELIYGEDIHKETIDGTVHRLNQCLGQLYRNTSFQDIIHRKNMRLYESEQFHTFRFNEVKVFIVMDLLFKDEENDKWIIVDWKTGKESKEDHNQLALYSLYLHEKYSIPHDKIEVRNEYLTSGEQRVHTIQTNNLDQVNEVMLMSISQMLQYVEDVEQNRPVALQQFEKSENPAKCAKCNFRKICERDM
jgi:CRISPR/Cas system-associated exonuclease Cas4 (RecB family)